MHMKLHKVKSCCPSTQPTRAGGLDALLVARLGRAGWLELVEQATASRALATILHSVLSGSFP